jgi:hypothetical protein
VVAEVDAIDRAGPSERSKDAGLRAVCTRDDSMVGQRRSEECVAADLTRHGHMIHMCVICIYFIVRHRLREPRRRLAIYAR